MHPCFPASAPRGLCLIRYQSLIGCFNKTFCSVKYTVLRRKLCYVGQLVFLTLFYLTQFLKQAAVKTLTDTVECDSFLG